MCISTQEVRKMEKQEDKELQKWIELYENLSQPGRQIVLANANVLAASEQMRKEQEVVA